MAIRTGPPLLPNKPAAIVFAVLIAVVSIGLKPWPVLRALWLGGAALLFYALRPAAYTPVSARIGSPFRRGLLTTRATPSNTPAEVTHVFIGSGLSSLTSAALLARTGAKCLVLEQHDVVGGGTHSYELGTRGEGGPWKFDSGLHYTVPESELLVDMCTGKTGSAKVDLMGLRESEIPKWAGGKDGNVANKGPIDFSPGAKEENIVYERIVIGSSSAEPFHIALWQKHLPALYAKFPKLKADIDRWLYHADKAVNSIPVYVLSRLLPQWLQDLVGPYLLKTFRKYAGMTTEEAFELVTENVELRNLLSSLWIDIGSPPVRGTFMLTAAVVHGFPQRGGAYPRGGSEELGMALVRTIERYGGKVLVKAEVAEILTEKQAGGWKATGVKLRDGTVVKAGTVVSSIGYSNTWNKLVSQAVTKDLGIPRTLDDKIPPSAGFVMVNIGFKATRKEMELGSFNTWYLPTDKKGDCFGAIREQFADPVGWIEEAPCMITFPSIKDRAFDEPRETCQVLVMIDGNPHFEKWLGKESGKAKEGADMEEYEALKKKWGDACVKRVMELYPKIKQEHIGLVDVSTPCSIAHYIRSPGGGAVGLDQTPRRFTDPELQRLLDTRTKVEGLWQTGQDTLICGQPLVQLAGMITAWRWLGFWKTAGLVLQTAMWELEMDEEDT